MNPPNIEWTKEHGWPQYLTYNDKTKEYNVDIWRDDLEGNWRWAKTKEVSSFKLL